MTVRPLLAGLLAPALLFVESASAQLSGTLDLGAGAYRPDRAIPGGVASIAPTMYLDGRAYRVGASGIYTDAPGGRWNFQGAGMGQLRSPELGPLQLEATGQVELTRHFSARGVTAATAELRGYLRPAPGTTLWVGRLRGAVTSLSGRRPLNRTLFGASTRVGGVEVGLSVASSTFDLFGSADQGARDPSDTLVAAVPTVPTEASSGPAYRRSLTDALVSTRWRVAGTDLDLTLGRRFGHNTPDLTIWGVSASRSLTPSVALVAGAGRSGSDPVTAVPGSRYVVAGLRLRVGSASPAVVSPAPTVPDRTPFRVGPPLPAGREIVVHIPGASQVELAGDFSDWRPIPLQAEGSGAWRAVVPIRPGLHRLAIRVNRGEWRAPPGLRAIHTEFGGEVAEIVVE